MDNKLTTEYNDFLYLVSYIRGKKIDQYEVNEPCAGPDGRLNLKSAAHQIVDVLAANKVNFSQIDMVFDVAKYLASSVSVPFRGISFSTKRKQENKPA